MNTDWHVFFTWTVSNQEVYQNRFSMKPIIKYFIVASLVIGAGVELSAQEAKKKKKQDSTYLQNKQRADEQRNREEEERRKNDSLKVANHGDSIAQILRNDSLKYDRTRRDSINSMEQQRRQDSIDKSQPPKNKGKKSPPKNTAQCAAGSTQWGTKEGEA